MFKASRSLVLILALVKLVASAPTSASATVAGNVTVAASSTGSAASSTATVDYVSTDPNEALWSEDSDPSLVKPERGTLGASIIGPDNLAIDLQNPDLLAPPTTDSGTM